MLTIAEMRKQVADLLATTRYTPETEIPLDEHGLPIIAPEPDDPDDE